MKHINVFHRIAAVLLCLCMLLPLSACGETKMYQKQVFAMDTVMTLTAYGNKGEAGLNAAQSVITSMDSMLDPDVETSTTYAINHAEGANVSVSGQVAKMLSTAQTVYNQSGGTLDLSLYPVIKRWGFTDGRYYVPSDDELAQDLARRAFDKMILTSFPSSGSYAVSFPAGTEITFGAVAKGCASDYAIQAMRAAGVTSGVVSLGGNVQTLGKKPDGSDWNIAIQDPNDTGSYLGYLTVGETAVITSGSYQRYFTEGGQKYHHILSPTTGRPVNNGLLAVTIVCEDGTLADCLSTAMFVLGPQAALNYWRTYGGFEMLLVKTDGHVVLTNGLYGQFTPNGDSYVVDYAS